MKTVPFRARKDEPGTETHLIAQDVGDGKIRITAHPTSKEVIETRYLLYGIYDHEGLGQLILALQGIRQAVYDLRGGA